MWVSGNRTSSCIQAGAAGYVIKDIERFELKRSIRTVYNGEAVRSLAVAGQILERCGKSATLAAPGGGGNPLQASNVDL